MCVAVCLTQLIIIYGSPTMCKTLCKTLIQAQQQKLQGRRNGGGLVIPGEPNAWPPEKLMRSMDGVGLMTSCQGKFHRVELAMDLTI